MKTYKTTEKSISFLLKKLFDETGDLINILLLLDCYPEVQKVMDKLNLNIDELKKKSNELKEKEYEKKLKHIISYFLSIDGRTFINNFDTLPDRKLSSKELNDEKLKLICKNLNVPIDIQKYLGLKDEPFNLQKSIKLTSDAMTSNRMIREIYK